MEGGASERWSCTASRGLGLAGQCKTLNPLTRSTCSVCLAPRPPRSAFSEATGRRPSGPDLEEFLRRHLARSSNPSNLRAEAWSADGDVFLTLHFGDDQRTWCVDDNTLSPL